MSTTSFDFLGAWLMIVGLVIAAGSVHVIDWLAWFGRKSGYWTEATIRAHKVTKPIDWAGAVLALLGGFIFYRDHSATGIPLLQLIIWVILYLNGAWLSFVVSPELLRREKSGRAAEILPPAMQGKITASFTLSIVGWWTEISLLAWVFVHQ